MSEAKCYRCDRWPCECRDGITLVCGDFRALAPQLNAEADMVLSDPPYGETNIAWDRWPDGWVDLAAAAAKPNASLWCFGSTRMFISRLADFNEWRFVQDIVWEKHNGSGFLVDRFRRVHELAYHFVPAAAKWSDVHKSTQYTYDARARTVRKKQKPAHWHGATGATEYKSIDGGPRLMRSVWRVRSCHGRSHHPTEKPQGVLLPLVDYSCPPDGRVLIPFAGSGSELVAAKTLGRKAVGVEVNEAYCEVAAKRLEQGVLAFEEAV